MTLEELKTEAKRQGYKLIRATRPRFERCLCGHNVHQWCSRTGMEQVEKVWRGGWEPGNPICPICGKDKFDGLYADIWADWMPNFCPHCGAPMTDEAVEMVMERMEEMYADRDT